uniref:FBD domain-containing protein n=1 Tax=Aegilops tauschii subsp. strangulata TaxID=200361 RepID=A0A453PYM6_AEGTS
VVLEGLSAATNLELTSDDRLSVFRMDLKWSPVFSKLKTLLLNEWCVADDFTGLVYFLQHSPILETLMLQLDTPKYKYRDYMWMKQMKGIPERSNHYYQSISR